jgi:hypothetical protein
MLPTDHIDKFLEAGYRIHEIGTGRIRRWVGVTIQHPLALLAAPLYLLRVPVVSVEMSPAERADSRWMYNRSRPWRLRGFVSSYLEVPPRVEDYWHGPKRQQIRRRTTQAKTAGLTVRSVATSEIVPVIAQVYRADIDGRVHEIEPNLREMKMRKSDDPLERAVCVGVFDTDGSAVAFSLGIQTGNAVITMLSGTAQRGPARWLCFSGLVSEVSARGAKYIIQSPPWSLTEGNKIFAHHLGFVPGRIRAKRTIGTA